MWQTINSVCLCHAVCLSVCTLTVAFLDLSIFAKSGIETTTHKIKNEFAGVNIAPPLPLFGHKNRHFWPQGPENPRKHKYVNFCLKWSRIAGIPASHWKLGSMNRPDVEMSQFRACALKNMQYSPNSWPNRRNFRALQEIWVEKHNGYFGFHARNRN